MGSEPSMTAVGRWACGAYTGSLLRNAPVAQAPPLREMSRAETAAAASGRRATMDRWLLLRDVDSSELLDGEDCPASWWENCLGTAAAAQMTLEKLWAGKPSSPHRVGVSATGKHR